MGKHEKEIDICIIGSGAGGAVAAYALGKAGFSVLVLEAGPRFKPKDYHTDEKDWEVQPNPFEYSRERKKEAFYTHGATEKLDPAYDHLRSKTKAHGFYNKTKKRRPPYISRVKGVGGSTLHYQGEAHRFAPHGFRMKSLYGVADDWPVTYKDLEPYYEKVENFLRVSGPDENQFKSQRGPFPQAPHHLSCASTRVKKGFDKLGLHLIPNTLNILSKSHDGRPACNYCNGCYLGCKISAKGSMDVTYIKQAEAMGNVEIRPESVVREITIDKNGAVDGAVYFDSKKNEHRIKAKLVVLSAGALETPRLLLNSKSSLFPDGLANSSGNVGRYFMETVTSVATALFSEQIHSYKGLQIDSRSWDYNKPDKGSRFTGGITFGVTALDLLGPLSYAKLLAPGWGSGHRDFMKKYFGHAMNVFATGEHLPYKDNTVSIDTVVKDSYGIHVAKVTTMMRNNELEMLSFMAARCREIVEAAGAEDILREYGSYDLSVISHMSGTCRMGTDPDKSVLNSFCRSHDIKNLFVMDSSCFVTEGGGDSPSLTIHALALRAADHIIHEYGKSA